MRQPVGIAKQARVFPEQLLQGGAGEGQGAGLVRARHGNRRAPGEAGGVGPGACARVGGDHVARTRAEDGAFEQRVRREPVGAVHTRARHLADGVEARQARAAEQVGRDAAHEIVRGGRHGDGLSRPVPPALAHGAVDRRKAAGEE